MKRKMWQEAVTLIADQIRAYAEEARSFADYGDVAGAEKINKAVGGAAQALVRLRWAALGDGGDVFALRAVQDAIASVADDIDGAGQGGGVL